MKILTVVGNRPQFIKAAAVSGPLRERHEEILVHTGQHYDDSLSRVFFTELGLARPDRELGIGGGSNTSQTARMLAALEPLLEAGPARRGARVRRHQLDARRRAGRGAGAHPGRARRGGHALVRPRDARGAQPRARPTTSAELLLCASDTAAGQPEGRVGRRQGRGRGRRDGRRRAAPAAVGPRGPPRRRAHTALQRGSYLLLTAHRAGNVDDPARLRALVALIEALPGPVLFPLHPRTRARLQDAGLLERARAGLHGLTLTEPLGYVEFSALLCQARAVLTDSGGVQKEAYLAGVPCVTLRANTEWVETVQAGWNTLVDLDADAALAALAAQAACVERPALYGDGHAAERCVQAIGDARRDDRGAQR